ncbi:MAG: DUF4082 domain-containing protein [Bacteroidota bacterium]|nr:DUF4082 domain-containing protein [Bacteroidota bacterium]
MVRTLLSSACRKGLFALFFTFILCGIVNAQNPIVTENALAGTPKATWDISGAGDLTIQGFATDLSVNKGQTVHFKIDVTPAASYTITIYRLGYYQGNGARLIASLGTFAGTSQGNGLYDASTGLLDCSPWTESASWAVPSTAVSGLYIAKLTKTGGGSSHIPFIVRDDASTSDILLKTSDNTWQAYNAYGGNSLYVGSTSFSNGHAAKVSLNRPYITRSGGGGGGVAQDWFMNAEYPMIRWLERNGYNISYTTDMDMDRSTTPITPSIHKVIISSGHDEYWSLNERNKFENAMAAGVHLAFFSGNEVYWKVRWENNNRTLVCYKEGSQGENVCGGKCDPTSAWTGLWRDGALYDAGKPENGLTGQISWSDVSAAITVTGAYKSLHFWRGTSVASLSASGSVAFTAGTLGYEWDFRQWSEIYPHGQIALSSQTVSGKEYRLSLYRHPSGALVFGAGTVQWAWGLDNIHDNGSAAANKDMQQATVNLFADMGVQPATLMSGLTLASASTDFTAPVVKITSPANSASLAVNNTVTITGTGSDAGGVVAGVEISVDGGATWQLVNGTTSWTYSWTPTLPGAATIKVRGFDDSGNMSVPGASGSSNNINVTITGSNPTCPCTIFPSSVTPVNPLDFDGQPLELGLKFRSSQAGYITGIRFWKGGAANNGTHIGHLWSNTGTKLGEATFTGETSSGWQTVTFASPVPIVANTTYVASYFSPSGYYSSSNPFFSAPITNGYLTALEDGQEGPNGIYIYTSTGAFPGNNYQSTNNWVDVVYNPTFTPDTTHPAVSITAPVAGNVSGIVNVTANATDNIGVAGVQFLLNGANLGSEVLTAPFTTSWNTTTVVNGTYTLTARARDGAGNTTTSAGVIVTVNNVPDTTRPTVSITAPAAGTVSGNVTISANASDNVGVAGVQFLLNGAAIGAEDVAAPYSISWSSFTVANGTYTLTARARDAAGNTTVSAGVVITVSNSSNLIVALPLNEGTGTATADFSGNNHNGTLSGATWTTGKYGQGVSLNGTSNYINIPDHTDFTLDPAQSYTWSGWVKNTSFKEWSCVWSQTVDGNNFFYFYAHTSTDPDGGPVTNGVSVYWWTSGGTNKIGAHSSDNVLTLGQWSHIAVTYDASQPQNNRFTIYVNGVDVTVRTDIASTGTITAIDPTNIRIGSDQPYGEYLTGAVDEVRFYKRLLSAAEVQTDMNSPIAPDVTPPTVLSVSPLSGATGVSTSAAVSAIFSEALNASTVSGTTFQLRDASNTLVTATVTYNAATNTATLTPSAALSNSTVYTATITGGASGVKDIAGNALASNFTWSFTTVAADVTPPTVSSVSPLSGATGVSTGTALSAIFSEALNASTVSGTTFQLRNASNTLVTATVTYNAVTNTATLTPSAALANSTVYTATITGGASGVKDIAGNALVNNFTWSFTTVVGDTIPPSVSSVSPVNGATGVSTGTTVIANFSEAVNASTVTTSTFQLKDAGNNVVAATVATVSGQSTLTPSSSLVSGTLYTATITGGASGVKDLAGNALASNFSWSFTTAVADIIPPTVSSVSPANGATGISIGTTVSGIFSEAMTASTISSSTIQLRDASNTLVTATVTYNAGTLTATLTPSAALAYSTTYTATIKGGASGVKDAAGNALASDFSWSFTTVAAPPVTVSIFPATSTPTDPADNDGLAIEVGVKFRVTQAGFITGIRFYKGAANTGTHIGHIWSSTGTRLGEATFTGETASGWQQVLFATPVAVATGTTYIASYFSSAGYYAASNPYFTTAVVNGPLRALADGEDGSNGVYIYATASAFPNLSYQSSNYWVDVVFTTSLSGRMSGHQPTQQLPAGETEAKKLVVKISPNPSSSSFKLIAMSDDKTPVTVRIIDMSGRVLENYVKVVPNSLLRLGETWTTGTYFAEVVQGDQRKVIKIIKVNQ